MPVSLQIDRLERELAARLGEGFTVVEADLEELQGADRNAALDAVVGGVSSPFVLIDGVLVADGSVDVEAVLAALGLSGAEAASHR